MPSITQLYKITHSSPEIKTVGEYLDELNSPAYIYASNKDSFLSIVGEDGLTNRQRIEGAYRTPEEKSNIGAGADKLPLSVGTILYIEYSKVNKVSFVTEGIGVVSTDEVAFKASKLAELEGDGGYISVTKPINGQLHSGSLKEQYPDCTVWIWCRSLSANSEQDSELTGQLFDLTPFIMSLSTNMGKNGGNFQLTLPPIVCELDDKGMWAIKEDTVTQYASGNTLGNEYASDASLFNSGDGGSLAVNKFLFHNMVRPNDLVFIRFETLKMEAGQRYDDAKKYLINKSNLANRIYDMIGLVDENDQSISPASNDVSINIEGRDLSKLFIEDGTYFFALENSNGLLKFAGQTTQKNSQISRIFGDGALNFTGLYQFTSIEYIFKFVLQQLANIKLVPDELLGSYQYSTRKVNGVIETYDGRNERYNETGRAVTNKNPPNLPDYTQEYKKEAAPGIWQIVKLVIDASVSDRRLADSGFSTAQGSLLNFFRSAAQEPLVEFYMDTYGDQYHLIIRKPPHDQKALLSLVEGKPSTEGGTPDKAPAIIDIEAEDVLSEKLSMDDSNVYSWYHFFPSNDLIGDSKNFSLSYMGALYFEEYAQVFGSKPFQRSHPYLPFVAKNRSDSQQLDIYEKQAILDLKYVIDCNQYMPFTRKGVLQLNGDRRLKIGNVIRYKPTGEIFFIDSVRQSFQISEGGIDRTTTVRVSRGMVEQLIYGVKVKNEQGAERYVSYFNLIDTRLNFGEKKITTETVVSVKTGTRVVQKQNFSLLHPFDALQNLFANISTQPVVLKNPSLVKGQSYLESYNDFPQNKSIFIKFINAVTDQGFTAIIKSGARTFAQQAALKFANGNFAAPGHSLHEAGRAIDISFIQAVTGGYYTYNTSEEGWRFMGIPAIANSFGLQWGGDANNGTFGTPGTKGYLVDRNHFQLTGTLGTVNVVEDVYTNQTQQKSTTVLDRDGIFSNFKVNKFTFNFFLKNLQFDQQYRLVKNKTVYQSDQTGSIIK